MPGIKDAEMIKRQFLSPRSSCCEEGSKPAHQTKILGYVALKEEATYFAWK